MNARRPTSMGGAYWAESWVAVIIYIRNRRARARALLEAVPPVFEIKWGTDEASLNGGIRWEGVRGRRPDCKCQLAVVPTQLRRLSRLVIKRPWPNTISSKSAESRSPCSHGGGPGIPDRRAVGTPAQPRSSPELVVRFSHGRTSAVSFLS